MEKEMPPGKDEPRQKLPELSLPKKSINHAPTTPTQRQKHQYTEDGA
jgi:hypothetical protein